MKDAINLIDIEDKTVRKDSVLSSNQIKTRKSSFEAISGKWNKFRVSLLSKKLERTKAELEEEKQNLATSVMNNEKVDYSKAIELNDTIARLEEKISVLSRETVPSKFEQNRAIKIKGGMMNNLQANSSEMYAGEAKASESYSDSGFSIADMAAAADTSDIDVAQIAEENDTSISSEVNAAMGNETPISRDDIKSVIDQSFAAIDEGVKEISPEDVEKTITGSDSEADISTDTAADEIDEPSYEVTDASDIVTDNVEDTTGVSEGFIDDGYVPENDSAFVAPESETTFGAPEVESEAPAENVISREEVEAEINRRINEQMDQRVSQNESTSAKTNHFDEDGFPKRREREAYVPMTDEQIEQAKENIEFDKYEQQYAEKARAEESSTFTPPAVVIDPIAPVVPVDTSTRDDVVVVTDRDDEDLHFDYSNATVGDVARATTIETSAQGLEALKARILELRAEQKDSKEEAENASKRKSEVAQSASDIDREDAANAQELDAAMGKLNDFREALEEDIRRNREKAALEASEAQEYSRHIQEKRAEIDERNRMISEIYSYIGPEAVNVRVVDDPKEYGLK